MFVHEYLQYILNALRAHKNVKSFLYTNIYIGDLKIYNKKKPTLYLSNCSMYIVLLIKPIMSKIFLKNLKV